MQHDRRAPIKRFLRWLWHKPQHRLVGRIEYATGHHRLFYPYGGGPMNGQTVRLEIARSILENCAVTRIVETGTFRGTTTQWLAQFGLPVVTSEISPRYAAFARKRLERFPNVELRQEDSVAMLRDLRTSIGQSTPIFFYLDAHWREHLPLKEELDLIAAACRKAVVMIDDFKVPGDPGYGYDDYGPGKVLDLRLLDGCKIVPAVVFFPSVASDWETGSRRGCLVFTHDPRLVSRLQEIPLLRSYTVSRVDTEDGGQRSTRRTQPAPT